LSSSDAGSRDHFVVLENLAKPIGVSQLGRGSTDPGEAFLQFENGVIRFASVDVSSAYHITQVFIIDGVSRAGPAPRQIMDGKFRRFCIPTAKVANKVTQAEVDIDERLTQIVQA